MKLQGLIHEALDIKKRGFGGFREGLAINPKIGVKRYVNVLRKQ